MMMIKGGSVMMMMIEGGGLLLQSIDKLDYGIDGDCIVAMKMM
jgi:hypothetical protein